MRKPVKSTINPTRLILFNRGNNRIIMFDANIDEMYFRFLKAVNIIINRVLNFGLVLSIDRSNIKRNYFQIKKNR